MMTHPKCPICETDLKPSGKYWVCPNDNFFFRVTRGVPGRPMWGVQEAEVEKPEESEVERVKREHGVEITPEGLEYLKRHKGSFRDAIQKA